MVKLTSSQNACVDSLRMTDRDQELLLAKLDHLESKNANDRRTDSRNRYVTSGLIVQMHHPGGSVLNYLVRARNLSRRGIAFLHGSFVYNNTLCVLALKSIDNQTVRTEGHVHRCRHVAGHVHEVAVKFKHPINLRNFLINYHDAQDNQESSTPLPQLKGKVLYVEDSINDQELLKFQLGNLGVEVVSVSNGLEALQRAEATPFDLIITGVWLPGMSGPEIAEALQEQNFTGPVLALTSDERPETHLEAIARGCSAVLVKPYDFEQLIELLRQYLRINIPANGPIQPLLSTYWSNAKMQPLIRGFLERLDGQLRDLGRHLAQPDNEQMIQRLCLEIKGSGGGYGFPQISQAAQNLFQSTMNNSPPDQRQAAYTELERLGSAALLVLQPSFQEHPTEPRDPAKPNAVT